MARTIFSRIASQARRAIGATRHALRAKTLIRERGGHLIRAKSSWITSFTYDDDTGTLKMMTKAGRTYRWEHVPVDIAKDVMNGNATCTSNDPTGRGRWKIGDTPSFGAAYNHILKGNAFVSQTRPEVIENDEEES